ncbi:MAG: 2-oxoacid:acceptor oxidoreductase family protein [Candidatus Omnitrophica bacterium]|nr:2-oxoacid:acceptor oxidoreductase family protein [Candidatus Omnitrophota bacterium]MCM8828296.1 2-oxoacid:acceptor oxidoreductase family protein [Candidatus Omnitrophota bacterium]
MKNRKLRWWKIILGGSGGQGIVTIGKVLAYAGAESRLNVSFLPAYGAEMRGGYVYSMISFSTGELVSPVISRADYGVFMNETSLQMLKQYLKEDAWILWNSSLINPEKERRTRSIGIPASELAEKLGDVRVANMIMLGGLIKILVNGEFPAKEKNVESGIKEIIKEDKLSLNRRALLEGKRIVEQVMNNARTEV